MFADAPFIAPSMTFGALALAWGRSPAELLADLHDPPGLCSRATSDAAPAP
jgi:hypothetical protein